MRKLFNSFFNRAPEREKKHFLNRYGESPIGVCRLNHDFQWVAVNQKMGAMLGFINESDLMKHTPFFDHFFMDPSLKQTFRETLKSQKKLSDFHAWVTTRDGHELQVTISAQAHYNQTNRIHYYEMYVRETDQPNKRKDNITILTHISQAVETTRELGQLYKKIHRILDETLDAPNFYIGIIDEIEDALFFPYYVDELDDIWEIHNISDPETRCLSLEVIRSRKPLLITKEMIVEEGVEVVGPVPEIWIGIPLKVNDAIIGLMSIQHYNDPNHFSHRDIEMLTLVSEQISLAIEKRMRANIPESPIPETPGT